MDQAITNVCIIISDEHKAIDHAVWLNFINRSQGTNLFFVITTPNEEFAVVSEDIWEAFMEDGYSHALYGDATDLSYQHLDSIAQDDDPLPHWETIRGAFSTVDGEVLRFILSCKVPLEKFIRHELSARGHDENGTWIGFEKAKELWQKEIPNTHTQT